MRLFSKDAVGPRKPKGVSAEPEGQEEEKPTPPKKKGSWNRIAIFVPCRDALHELVSCGGHGGRARRRSSRGSLVPADAREAAQEGTKGRPLSAS